MWITSRISTAANPLPVLISRRPRSSGAELSVEHRSAAIRTSEGAVATDEPCHSHGRLSQDL